MLSAGFDLNKQSNLDGHTALCAGCAKADYEMVTYFLEMGATMDVSTSARNPLFSAIIGRSSLIARLLLDKGIDAKARYTSETMINMDAIAFALERGEKEIARIVAEWNADGDLGEVARMLAEGESIADENNRP